jgi:hypothetical protein
MGGSQEQTGLGVAATDGPALGTRNPRVPRQRPAGGRMTSYALYPRKRVAGRGAPPALTRHTRKRVPGGRSQGEASLATPKRILEER